MKDLLKAPGFTLKAWGSLQGFLVREQHGEITAHSWSLSEKMEVGRVPSGIT